MSHYTHMVKTKQKVKGAYSEIYGKLSFVKLADLYDCFSNQYITQSEKMANLYLSCNQVLCSSWKPNFMLLIVLQNGGNHIFYVPRGVFTDYS